MSSPLPPDTRKVVLITGCSSGIGRALALDFAKAASLEGALKNGAGSASYRVFACARKLEALRELPPAIERVQMDVCDDASVQAAIKTVIDEAGHIDVLINNAGVNTAVGPSLEVPLARFQSTFDANFFGLIRVTQAVLAHMTVRRSGTIVNIGSTAAYANIPFGSAYCASKAAVHSFSDALRGEVAALGIRVLVVAPGAIKSSFGDNAESNLILPAKGSGSAYDTDAARAIVKYRAQYSQTGNSTPATVTARIIREEVDKSFRRRTRHSLLARLLLFPWLFSVLFGGPRAYLTTGARSTKALILFYLPIWLRDRFIARHFMLDKLRQ